MKRLTVESPLAQQLQAALEPMELCDPTGRVVGQFFPQPDPLANESLEPPISDEELERRRTSNERTYTTAEVLAYLEKLP